MVPLSMTLSDLGPGVQGHNIFNVEYLKNDTRYRAIVTIEHQYEVACAVSNGDISNVIFPMTFSDPIPVLKVTVFFEG